jgi:hypothetical protein
MALNSANALVLNRILSKFIVKLKDVRIAAYTMAKRYSSAEIPNTFDNCAEKRT